MKMTFRHAPILLAVLAMVLGGYVSLELSAAAVQAPAQSVEFIRDVRPVLAESCFACHGPAEATRQADLRLDTSDFLGTVVVPGDADGSRLFQRLATDETIGRMPPVSSGRSLTADQIDMVRRWIDTGAEWGSELASADVGATPVTARTVDFAREVRPILSENCFTCHGPDEGSRQRGLRLDVPEGPFADRSEFGGPVVFPGNADDSLLIHRVLCGCPSDGGRCPRVNQGARRTRGPIPRSRHSVSGSTRAPNGSRTGHSSHPSDRRCHPLSTPNGFATRSTTSSCLDLRRKGERRRRKPI